MTRNLRNNSGDILVQFEVSVLDQEAADPPEIDRREEILKVEIEDVAAVPMLSRVGDYRPLTLEAMGRPILAVLANVYLVETVLKES